MFGVRTRFVLACSFALWNGAHADDRTRLFDDARAAASVFGDVDRPDEQPTLTPLSGSTAADSSEPLAKAPPPVGIHARIDKQLNQVLVAFDSAFASIADSAALERAAKAAAQDLAIEQLTGVQLGRLLRHPAMLQFAGLYSAVRSRLASFLDTPGPDGATAAVHFFGERLSCRTHTTDRMALYKHTFGHPALEIAAAAGAVNEVLTIADPRKLGLGPTVAPHFLALNRLLTPECAPHLATSFDHHFDALTALAQEADDVELEQLRKRMVDLAEHALEAVPLTTRPYLRDVIAYLRGAYARGTLLGNSAPSMEFLWTSDADIESLADLSGRVVVLEFWATWCAPCIASLPHMRALQSYYSGRPVQIIAITEVHGWHQEADGTWLDISTAPQREFQLMRRYINDNNVSWLVAFADDAAFAEYGVRGVPHIVIIDSHGIVRHRALHPMLPLFELTQKIDALLDAASSSPMPNHDELSK